MNESQAKELCLALMHADSEEEVISLLKAAQLWDDPSLWRYYGDYENNYNTIGNQQGRPDAALVEKIINSVDARLMNECLVRGIDPEGPQAPQSIREAVGMFFDDHYNPSSPHAGQIKKWPDAKRTEIARGLTLIATGAGAREGNPCFTVADCGEGQTPEKMPLTLLSLNRSNKLRIPFVQGKFNMGGTGVFEFCGPNGLQLVVSRRNPAILKGRLDHGSDDQWGFTIVRRESEHVGVRSSVYCYLAPVGPNARRGQGGVLRFSSATMPIFPQGRSPYARESQWGTLVKLYEYAAIGFKSNIILTKPSLLNRMDLLLPDVALPARLHECRPNYKGHEGSFETTLSGVSVRLEDDRSNNLEEGFPSSCPISAIGEQMTATIYAFKKGKAESYRKQEGIIFVLNGQTHGHLTQEFFTRKSVGLSYLADSILVSVDCSKFGIRAREILFLNSRDRLRSAQLRQEIEHALEEMLKQHQGLRDLRERRRREQTESKLADSKPLEEILESLLKKSPTLANLFLKGNRASNPFKTIKVRGEEKPYDGVRYPTYFKFKGKDYGEELVRDTAINLRSRITFETDAENEYFSRSSETGEFSLFLVDGDLRTPVASYVGPNLQNGAATLSVELPPNCRVGDCLKFVSIVNDPSRGEPFENRFAVRVQTASTPTGTPRSPRKPASGTPGNDREAASGIALPTITEVSEAEWGDQKPAFDKYTALRIKGAGVEENGQNGDGKAIFDFYVNIDNLYLKTEMKPAHSDPQVTQARFTYGLVLLGLALLQQDEIDKKKAKSREEEEEEEPESCGSIEERVELVAKAVAPVLLPMIESLGELDEESIGVVSGAGEAT